jgi:hypothetical protein
MEQELGTLSHQSPLSLDYLYVPKCWFDYYKHPITLTAVDISQSASIEIGTEEFVSKGISTFEIHSIESRGKWLPLSDYQRTIIMVWIVTLFGYLLIYLWSTNKKLHAEQFSQTLINITHDKDILIRWGW